MERIHMLHSNMTGALPLAWARCGEPVPNGLTVAQLSGVTCPACRRIVLRERREDRKWKAAKP